MDKKWSCHGVRKWEANNEMMGPIPIKTSRRCPTLETQYKQK